MSAELTPGYCGVTELGGNCRFGSSGAWLLSEAESSNLQSAAAACASLCAACGQCRFYSVSAQHRDCSWFQSCSTRHLLRKIGGFYTGTTPTKRHNETRTQPRRRARRHFQKGRLASDCFEEDVSPIAHAEGRWVEMQEQLPTIAGADTDHPYHCTHAIDKLRWAPSSCSLPTVDRTALCAALKGKHVLVVGDSTGGQLYLSLAFQLGATRSRPTGRARHELRERASACNDSVRLSFVRNDLLLWTTNGGDLGNVRACDASAVGEIFVRRAAQDADVLLLALGLHWAGAIEEARVRGPPELEGARLAFSSKSLRHTLESARAARAAHGHHVESMALLTAPLPTPGCSSYATPFESLEEWTAADASSYGVAKYALRWRQQQRLNVNARWIAEGLGVPYLDIGPLSALRPDATMAHSAQRMPVAASQHRGRNAGPRADTRPSAEDATDSSAPSRYVEDCVHYCLPGPPMVWVDLVAGHLRRAVRHRGLWDADGSSSASRPHLGSRKSRVFQLELTTWLSSSEGADDFAALERPPLAKERLDTKDWWPFIDCSCERYPCREYVGLPFDAAHG